jgi:predicted PurR-regulated permease PerM
MKNKLLISLLLLIPILLLAWFFRNIVFYLAVSSVIALLGEPVVNYLSKIHVSKFRINRSLSSLITLLLFLFIFFGLISVTIPVIISQAKAIMAIDPEMALQNLLEPFIKNRYLFGRFQEYLDHKYLMVTLEEKLLSFLDLNRLTVIFNSIATFTGDIFIAIFSISFISFFFLRDKKIPRNAVLFFTPQEYRENIFQSVVETKTLLTRYFIGVMIQVLLIISLITFSLTILGVKNAFFIGFLAGILNIIPYIGPLFGIFFGIVLSVAAGLELQTLTELWPLIIKILVVFIGVQLLDNFLFQPYIYSSSIKAHPLEIFLIILIAGKIAGIPGVILAIPVYTIIRVIAKQFFSLSSSKSWWNKN